MSPPPPTQYQFYVYWILDITHLGTHIPISWGGHPHTLAFMAFTMHSHSGQFCPGHAKDQLEDIIKHAISLGYTTIGLTEHMPRTSLEDLYPEEVIGQLC